MTNPDARAVEIAGRLTPLQASTLRCAGSTFHPEEVLRVHWDTPLYRVRSLQRKGLLTTGSSKLTPLGVAVRSILESQ